MVVFDSVVYFFSTVSPAVHTLCSSMLQRLDSRGIYRSSHPDPRKKISSTADNYDLIIGPILLPIQVFFHVEEQKIWCQIRIIWRVINQLKATATHSSHCNHRLVCQSIVLVKQDSYPFVSFPSRSRNICSTSRPTAFQSPELLIQYGFIRKYQERLN